MTDEERRAIEHDCGSLIGRYANLNDSHDWEALANLFIMSGRLARPSAPEDWIEGRDAIFESLLARAPRATRHLCTNVTIDVIDNRRAYGESAMALFMPDQPVKLGSFHDRFEHTPDGWRFAERRGGLLW